MEKVYVVGFSAYKRRATYYQFYTDMKWGNVANYHITLNSGALGLDKCIEILSSMY